MAALKALQVVLVGAAVSIAHGAVPLPKAHVVFAALGRSEKLAVGVAARRGHGIRFGARVIKHDGELAPAGVDEPVGDLIWLSTVSGDHEQTVWRYLLIWRPVWRMSSCFSSSVGYGWCK